VEQSSRETVFLALVGQQPAATAVLLKSWVGESGPPDEIWLLATSHVERTGVAARLRAFCASVVPGTRCEVVPIASGLEDAAGRPSARTWVRDFLASRGQRAQVIFAGAPRAIVPRGGGFAAPSPRRDPLARRFRLRLGCPTLGRLGGFPAAQGG